MVETAFPRQRAMWECLWESKARSSLFREALHIMFAKQALPLGLPLLLSHREHCVVEGTTGDVVCLFVLLAGSPELSPSSL